jgi:hypothetical protein
VHAIVILKRRALPVLVLLVAIAPLLMGSSDLREDEFECEQAVSHLQGCCPASFDPTKVACEYESGCGSTTYPSLGIDDSKCIEQKSCDQILASGLCGTVEDLQPFVDGDGDDASATIPPRVCE